MAVNGVVATNLVQSLARAWSQNNTLTARDDGGDEGLGNILVKADNTSTMDATTKGATQSGDKAIGVVLAFNSVGWEASNVLFNAVDALLGDPLISEAFNGAGQGAVEAFLSDVTVIADGNLGVEATAASTITANLSNDATSAAAALKGANGSSVGVILASNKVNSSAVAYIENGGIVNDPDNPDIDVGGNVTVKAMDTAVIVADTSLKAESTVTNDFGLSAVADLADSFIDAYKFTTESGEQLVKSGNKVYIGSTYSNGTTGEIHRGSVFRYDGADNDGAGITLDLSNIDFVASDDWAELNPVDFLSSDGVQDVTAGIEALDFLPPGLDSGSLPTPTVVRVADGHGAGGEVGASYRFIGAGRGETVEDLDLSAEDYGDTERWVRVSGLIDTILDSAIVDALNLNFSDSNSSAVGVLIVMNDVRSDVDAYIDSTAAEVDGDVHVEAVETATITANDKSVVTSDGGSITGKGSSLAINGVIATNVVLSAADARITNSDLTAVGGDVDLDASNTSAIDAVVESSTKSNGKSIGVTLAFNSIGWQSQNFLFNTIDALIGTNIGDEQPASVSAKVMNTDVVAGGSISVDVVNDAEIDAQILNAANAIRATVGDSEAISVGAVITMNRLSTTTEASIEDSNSVVASTGDIDVTAVDTSTIIANVEASAVSVAVGSKSTGVAVGASIARNQINNDLHAHVDDVHELRASGDITVYGSETALIDASSIATAVSVALSAGDRAVSFAGGFGHGHQPHPRRRQRGHLGIDGVCGRQSRHRRDQQLDHQRGDQVDVGVGGRVGQRQRLQRLHRHLDRQQLHRLRRALRLLHRGHRQRRLRVQDRGRHHRRHRRRRPGLPGRRHQRRPGRTDIRVRRRRRRRRRPQDGQLRRRRLAARGQRSVAEDRRHRQGAQGLRRLHADPDELYRYTGADGDVDLGLANYNSGPWEKVSESNDTTPVEVHAYILDSSVDVDGWVDLNAESTAVIDATVNAISVAVAASSSRATGLSGAGVFTQNKVATSIKARVDGTFAQPDHSTSDGTVDLRAGDSGVRRGPLRCRRRYRG
ncbi:MAG: hypothetical protein M5U09_14690 [Gammaproteobacteria bacterium]|nr:hypothetical protein [Gammaproteobacteria bacterium]